MRGTPLKPPLSFFRLNASICGEDAARKQHLVIALLRCACWASYTALTVLLWLVAKRMEGGVGGRNMEARGMSATAMAVT